MKIIKKSAARNLKMQSRFNAVFEKRGKWWIGYVEELPGANSQGRTLKEVRENLKEAIKLVIETNRELSLPDGPGQNIIKEQIRVSV
jgi:predicted RNase H-like HicB family nuclease